MAYRRTPGVRARQAHTREVIVAAARASVASGGLAGTNMAGVAAGAGVAVGTLYRYFPSKADLIGEVVRDVCRHELEVVATASGRDRGTPHERLVAGVTTFARRALRSGRTAHAMITEPSEATVEILRLEIRSELAATFASVVADGIAAGSFPEQSPTVSGTALVGAVSEVLVGPISPVTDDPGDTATLLHELASFAVRAVDPRAASEHRVSAL